MTPDQCRAARGWLNWKQSDLAIASNIVIPTIRDFEAGKRSPAPGDIKAIKAALEKRGIAFIDVEPLGVSFTKTPA